MKKLLAMLLAAPFFSSCTSTKSMKENVSLVGEWQVLTAYGVSTEEAATKPFIEFQDSSKMHGNAGVNNFTGIYTLTSDSSLSFGNMGMTRMMGPNMHIEDAVVKALNSAKSIQSKGDVIVILDAEGVEAMQIKKK